MTHDQFNALKDMIVAAADVAIISATLSASQRYGAANGTFAPERERRVEEFNVASDVARNLLVTE